MKKMILCSVALISLCAALLAQMPANVSSTSSNQPTLLSAIYDWEKMQPLTVLNGVRRVVFDGPTATLDKINCHITTLNPPTKRRAAPASARGDVIVKEGTVEATYDGHSETVGTVRLSFSLLTPPLACASRQVPGHLHGHLLLHSADTQKVISLRASMRFIFTALLLIASTFTTGPMKGCGCTTSRPACYCRSVINSMRRTRGSSI